MTLRTLLSAIRRYWLTFVGVTLPLLGLGAAGLYFMPPQYVSTTELLVSIQGSTTAAAYQNDGVVAGRINSYIPLLTSDVVSQRVIDKLNLPLKAPELAAKISAVNVPPSTALIDVAVTDESPDEARLLADTVANEFISYAGALEMPSGEDDQKVSTTVVTGASEPKARIGELIVLGVAAALIAVTLGAMAVWMRARRGAGRPSEHQAVAVADESTSSPVPVSRAHATLEVPDSYHDPAPADVNAAAPEPAVHDDSAPAEVPVWAEEIETCHDPAVADVRLGADEPQIDHPVGASVNASNRLAVTESDVFVVVAAHSATDGTQVFEHHRRPRTRLRSRPTPTGGRELRLLSEANDPDRVPDSPDAATDIDLTVDRPAARERTNPGTQDDRGPLRDGQVNGSRHRAADDAPEWDARIPGIRVNGSRHRADADSRAPDALEPSALPIFVTGADPEMEVHPDNANFDGSYSGSVDDFDAKEWDGRRWIRRG